VLSSFFENTIYVRVKRNQFRVRHLESGTDASFQASPSFSTERLLIGQFTAAENLLRQAFREMFSAKLIKPSPQVLIQPLEMIDGGLSQVEERVLTEVAIGAGASKVVVWVGPELKDDEVKVRLNGKERAV
jgi:hypothetical protein